MNGEAACLKSCHLPLPRLRGSSGEAGEGVYEIARVKPLSSLGGEGRNNGRRAMPP